MHYQGVMVAGGMVDLNIIYRICVIMPLIALRFLTDCSVIIWAITPKISGYNI
jgi:hypothetical protein